MGKRGLQFSDTEDELINDDVESRSSCNRKRKRSISELNEMEKNLKLVNRVAEESISAQSENSVDKGVIMDQLELANNEKQKRI